MGENERIHPLSCSLSWEHHTGMCPFPTREDRLFSRAAPANTTASWPNTKAKPKECQPNTADMEAHFPVLNLRDSICPHSSIHRGKSSSLGTVVPPVNPATEAGLCPEEVCELQHNFLMTAKVRRFWQPGSAPVTTLV